MLASRIAFHQVLTQKQNVMIQKVIVKLIGEKAKGTSYNTGNEWRLKPVLLEWEDLEGTNRVWAHLFNEKMDEFDRLGIQQGDVCEVSLQFTARSYRTGYNKTEVEVLSIKKV